MVRIVKKPEERRSEIIEAACRLFLTRGYESTTMADIMAFLGIAKGTIYHYFSSKEDLLEAVILNVAEAEVQRLQEVLENAQGNALERLEYLIVNGASHEGREDHHELIEDLHKAGNDTIHIRLLALLATMQAPLYAEIFRQGCEEGLFQVDHPLECAEFLVAGIQFLTDMGIYPWTEVQLKRRWESFPTIIERQLNAPAGSFSFLLSVNPANQ